MIEPEDLALEDIEDLERMAQDTKKEFRYNKHTGDWAWMNRSDCDNVELWHQGFRPGWKR